MLTPTTSRVASPGGSSRSSAVVKYPKLNTPVALAVLVASTALTFVTAEHLVSSLSGLTASDPNLSKEFLSLIIIPILSNAAEHATAVVTAAKGKFDLALTVAVGSSVQIALFVVPFLVLLAWGLGKPLSLFFDPLETISLFLTILIVKFCIEDGKSHWMSGLVLLGVYVIIATSFWYFPTSMVGVLSGNHNLFICSGASHVGA